MKELSDTWLSKQKLDINLFLLLVVFLPSQFGYHFWPDWSLLSGIRVDYFSPTIYLTDIITVLVAIVFFLKGGISLKNKWILVSGIVLFAAINTIFSLNTYISVYKWFRVLELIFISYWVFKNKEIVKERITRALLVAIGYTTLLAILQFLGSETVGGIFYYLGERSFSISTPGIALVNILGNNYLRAYATFPHPNVLAGFSLVNLFIFLNFEKNKHVKWLGIVLCLLNITLSFSLGALIGLLICFGIYVLKSEKYISHIYKQIVLSMILVSIVLMPIAQSLIGIGTPFSESVENRLRLASVAGEEFAKSPVFGVGLGNFISYIPKSDNLKGLWFLQPAHNLFILPLSEVGATGLIVFSWLLLRLRTIKNPRQIFLVLPILITGLFDHYWLTIPETTFLFAIVVGILF